MDGLILLCQRSENESLLLTEFDWLIRWSHGFQLARTGDCYQYKAVQVPDKRCNPSSEF